MERDSAFSTKEIIGIAAAGAIALGGIIAALTRSQQRVSPSHEISAMMQRPVEQFSKNAKIGRRKARGITRRIAAAYPERRSELTRVVERASDEIAFRRDDVVELLKNQLPDAFAAGFANPRERVRERAGSAIHALSAAAPEMIDQSVAQLSRGRRRPNQRMRDSLVSIAALAGTSLVAYIVLLEPERRERVKDALCSLLAYGQVLSDDFRGYDDGY